MAIELGAKNTVTDVFTLEGRIPVRITLAAVCIVAPIALADHGSAATGDAPEWHAVQTLTYRGYLAAPAPPATSRRP